MADIYDFVFSGSTAGTKAGLERLMDDTSLLEYLPYAVGILVIGLAIRYLVPFIRGYYKLSRQVLESQTFLTAIAREQVVERFGDIDAFFRAKTPDLSHAWHEFDESLVKESDKVFNTIDAGHFFNAEDLIEGELQTDFHRHLPGIFTATGIVGTFLGIFLGLQKASTKMDMLRHAELEQAAGTVSEATQALLEHVGPAFGASFIAVLVALVFLFGERRYVSLLSHQIHRLQHELDRLFPRTTAEGLLWQMFAEVRQQTDPLKNFSSELSTSINASLEHMVSQQTRQMQESSAAATAELTRQLVAQLAPVAQQLKDAVTEMKKDHSTEVTGAIERMVANFQKSLTGSAQGQMEEMARAISGTASLLEGQRSALDAFVNTLGVEVKHQQKLLEEQLARQMEDAERQRRDSQGELNEFLKKLTTEMSDIQSRLLERSSNSVERFSTDVDNLLRKSMEHQVEGQRILETRLAELRTETRAGIEKMTSTLDEAVERISTTTASSMSEMAATSGGSLRELTEEIRQATRHSVAELTSTVTSSVEAFTRQNQSVSQELANLQQSLMSDSSSTLERVRSGVDELLAKGFNQQATAQETLRQNLAQLSSQSEASNQRLLHSVDTVTNKLSKEVSMLSQTVAEKVSGLSETFGVALGRTETLLKNMESVLTSTHQQASTYRELTEELAGITRSFQATSGNLNDGQTQLRTVVDRFVSLNAALDQRLAHSERQTEKLGDVTEALREAAEQLGTEITRQSGTLAELGEKTDGFFKRVNDDTSRYYNGVSTALQDYLNKTQDSLSRACSMLGSTVEELQEPLEELVGALTAKAGT